MKIRNVYSEITVYCWQFYLESQIIFLIKLSMLMINPVFQNKSKNDALCFFGGSKEAVSTTQTIHKSGQKIIKT